MRSPSEVEARSPSEVEARSPSEVEARSPSEVEARSPSEVEVRFSVEDTGQGMKPEDRDRLFSEYLRFNAEANRATEGTGLGLNITKKLVSMMGGAISVESEYGKGSVFTVTVKQKAVECPPIGADVAKQLCRFAFTDGKRAANLRITYEPMPYGSVLVVDDVSTNLYVAEGLLALYKLKVETADSGFSAVEKAEGGKVYDVVFMDHMMPGMDGVEAMQKMRDIGYKGAIVALTANALVGNDEMFRQKGFDGFISKPIDIHQLNAVLNKFVRDRHPEEAERCKLGFAPARPSAVIERSRDAVIERSRDAVIERSRDAVIERSRGDRNGVEGDQYHQQNGTDKTQNIGVASDAVNSAPNPQILKFFVKDAEKAIVTLRETAESGDIKLFTITAHAMKSALANVGETEASGVAAALEDVGRNGDMEFISANIGDFIKTLELLVEKFGDAGVDNVDNDNAAEDTDYLAEQLRIIKTACQDYDDDAAYAALDRLKEGRWRRSTAKSLEEIRDALFIFSDFDGAADRCGEFLENRKGTV